MGQAEKAAAKRELSQKQISFIVWSATPQGLRQPETREALIEVLGISRQTAWRWDQDPRVKDAIRFVVLQNAGSPGRVEAILDMVYEHAVETKNMKAAELWIKSVGLLSQFTRGNTILDALDDEDAMKDFSTEELERIREEMRAAAVEEEALIAAKERLSKIGNYDEIGA